MDYGNSQTSWAYEILSESIGKHKKPSGTKLKTVFIRQQQYKFACRQCVFDYLQSSIFITIILYNLMLQKTNFHTDFIQVSWPAWLPELDHFQMLTVIFSSFSQILSWPLCKNRSLFTKVSVPLQVLVYLQLYKNVSVVFLDGWQDVTDHVCAVTKALSKRPFKYAPPVYITS